MKKTMFMLAALCGVCAATAGTLEMDLLASPTGWQMDGAATTINSDGVLRTSGHWGSHWATYNLSTSQIELAKDETLTFSYTITLENQSDVCATVGLGTANGLLASGLKTYNGNGGNAPFVVGYSDEAAVKTAKFIGLNKADSSGVDYNLSGENTSVNGDVTHGGSLVDHTVTLTIKWGGDILNSYIGTFDIDGTNCGFYNAGEAVTLDRIVVSMAGNYNDYYKSTPMYSNMKLTIVPEPATATLSLLALAGLAARRRRH